MGGSLCTCLGRDKEIPLIPENHSGGSDSHGYAVAKNDREIMEDAIDHRDNLCGWKYYACFDGHGGDRAVALLKTRLPVVLEEHLKDEEDVGTALRAAFSAMETEVSAVLLEEAEEAQHIGITSGTTVCVTPWKGIEAFVANLGDSRAIISLDGAAQAIK